jgi:hypothetical protein
MIEIIYATIIFIITLLFFAATYQYMPMRENLENSYVYYPTKCDRYINTPDQYGLTYTQFWIPTDSLLNIGEEKDICAWLIRKNTDQTARKVIIYCHGNAGNLENTVPFIQKTLDRVDADILVFDYSGYGMSPGEPHERDMIDNLVNCIDFVLGHWQESDILLYGHSLGAAVAIQGAARLKNVRFAGIVLEAPFYSLEARAREISWMARFWNFYNKYENFIKIQMTKSPILFVHSPEDEIIHVSHSERLWELISDKEYCKGLVYIEGSHNDPTYTEEYYQKMNEMLYPSTTERETRLRHIRPIILG